MSRKSVTASFPAFGEGHLAAAQVPVGGVVAPLRGRATAGTPSAVRARSVSPHPALQKMDHTCTCAWCSAGVVTDTACREQRRGSGRAVTPGQPLGFPRGSRRVVVPAQPPAPRAPLRGVGRTPCPRLRAGHPSGVSPPLCGGGPLGVTGVVITACVVSRYRVVLVGWRCCAPLPGRAAPSPGWACQ